MSVHGRPRARIHKGSTMDYKRIVNAPIWALSEIIWYIKWWINLFVTITQKLYRFGELILQFGVKSINSYDAFLDELEVKISNLGRDNVLD